MNYQVIIFLISPQKHTLSVLIRNSLREVLVMRTDNICLEMKSKLKAGLKTAKLQNLPNDVVPLFSLYIMANRAG